MTFRMSVCFWALICVLHSSHERTVTPEVLCFQLHVHHQALGGRAGGSEGEQRQADDSVAGVHG